MNNLKYFFYWLTHPILCILGYHKLITWDIDDLQCWCCESDDREYMVKKNDN